MALLKKLKLEKTKSALGSNCTVLPWTMNNPSGPFFLSRKIFSILSV